MVIPRLTSFLSMYLLCFCIADDWRLKSSRDQRPRHPEPAVPSRSSLMPEFNDDVSPWNTTQSMRTSDDVAQLLVSDRIVLVSMNGRTEKIIPFLSIKRFCASFVSLSVLFFLFILFIYNISYLLVLRYLEKIPTQPVTQSYNRIWCFAVVLQAEVDEAVGKMSESTGSTRSQIDWEEVDKIMGET